MLRARVAHAILTAGKKSEKTLTQDAQHLARAKGWTTEAAGRVNVHHTGSAFRATFAGAEDFEYGTEDRPPLAAAREFEMTSHAGRADDVFATNLLHELRDLL